MSSGGHSEIVLTLAGADPNQTLGRLAVAAMALLLVVIACVVAALLLFSLRRAAARRAARGGKAPAGSSGDAWTEAGRRANPPSPDEAGPDDDTVDLGPDDPR